MTVGRNEEEEEDEGKGKGERERVGAQPMDGSRFLVATFGFDTVEAERMTLCDSKSICDSAF